MDTYEDLARQYCEMQFLRARKKRSFAEPVSNAGETAVLFYLFHEGDRVLVGEVSRELALTVARVTNILNSLEKHGYIVRERDREDKRKVYISLTEEGNAYIRRRQEEGVEQYRRLFERLGEADSREYLRIQKRIQEIATQMSRKTEAAEER